MKKKDPRIRLYSDFGDDISYLDGKMKRIRGEKDDDNTIKLETQVNHESKTEPFALPFIDGYSSNQYSNLIRAALIRAAICCSDAYDFEKEREFIEFSMMLNGFSSEFIAQRVTIFFLEFDMEPLDLLMYDQETYNELRQNVILYDEKCIQDKLKRHQQAQNYNLQYISVSTKNPYFRFLKQFGQRQRCVASANPVKFHLEFVGRPRYPSQTE
jgi:hypothetical protein